MKFNCQNDLVSSTQVLGYESILVPYIKVLKEVNRLKNYARPEGSINLPFDESIIKGAAYFTQTFKNIDNIFVVGIGGSNLGTEAIYDALVPKVNVIFFDTLEDSKILLLENINTEKTVVVAVTKSGKTTETIANLEIILEKQPKLKERLILISNKNTDFIKKGKFVAEIPQMVGGRYSVFSNVGIVPLAFCDFNIKALLDGAKMGILKSLDTNILENPAARSAISIYEANKQGKNVLDTFVFNPKLESLGKWYRQLVAESLGKKGKGILPTVSVGSSSLHSVVQMYLGGPENIYTNFVYSKTKGYNIKNSAGFTELIDNLEGKSSGQVLDAIYKGTIKAYIDDKIPLTEITVNEVDEEFLGEYMQTKMIEVMMLGKLMCVNAFDQPDVERYKEEARKLLAKS